MSRVNKYGNKKVTWDGITFDSKLEMQRYLFLHDLEKKGVISNLQMQVAYEVLPSQMVYRPTTVRDKVKWKTVVVHKKRVYYADFVYECNGATIVEDTKGKKTEVYTLKAGLMYERHGIMVRDIKRPTEPIMYWNGSDWELMVPGIVWAEKN